MLSSKSLALWDSHGDLEDYFKPGMSTAVVNAYPPSAVINTYHPSPKFPNSVVNLSHSTLARLSLMKQTILFILQEMKAR